MKKRASDMCHARKSQRICRGVLSTWEGQAGRFPFQNQEAHQFFGEDFGSQGVGEAKAANKEYVPQAKDSCNQFFGTLFERLVGWTHYGINLKPASLSLPVCA